MVRHRLHNAQLRISTFAVAAALVLSAGAALAQSGGGIDVVINQARIVKLARPADTVVIGNPEIADVSVQDASTIVLTGKGFGVTNLVILDEAGAPIVDEQVVVSRSFANSVRIYRRSQVQTLSCSPYCEGAFRTDAERQSEAEMNISP